MGKSLHTNLTSLGRSLLVARRLRDGVGIRLVSHDDLRTLAAHLDREPTAREPRRTGMALDCRFATDLSVYAKDTPQAAKRT